MTSSTFYDLRRCGRDGRSFKRYLACSSWVCGGFIVFLLLLTSSHARLFSLKPLQCRPAIPTRLRHSVQRTNDGKTIALAGSNVFEVSCSRSLGPSECVRPLLMTTHIESLEECMGLCAKFGPGECLGASFLEAQEHTSENDAGQTCRLWTGRKPVKVDGKPSSSMRTRSFGGLLGFDIVSFFVPSELGRVGRVVAIPILAGACIHYVLTAIWRSRTATVDEGEAHTGSLSADGNEKGDEGERSAAEFSKEAPSIFGDFLT